MPYKVEVTATVPKPGTVNLEMDAQAAYILYQSMIQYIRFLEAAEHIRGENDSLIAKITILADELSTGGKLI